MRSSLPPRDFLVAANGKIFTNLHVILQCQYVTVRLTGGDAYDNITVMAVDARRDLALIRIKGASYPRFRWPTQTTWEVDNRSTLSVIRRGSRIRFNKAW